MNDHPLVQALHAAISRRRWDEVEVAANRIRDDRGIGWPEENGSRHVENWKPRWRCAARKNSTPWGAPQDCNWPVCGCDPYADKVIDALQESGFVVGDKRRSGSVDSAPLAQSAEPPTCPLCRGAGFVTYRDGVAYETHDVEREEHLIEDCPECARHQALEKNGLAVDENRRARTMIDDELGTSTVSSNNRGTE